MSTIYNKPDVGEVIDVERLKSSGGKFFSKENMRGFNSRVCPEVFVVPDGWLFVTSERDNERREPREWSVRKLTADYQIENMSEYGEFSSKRQAMRFIVIGRYLKLI